MKSHNRIDFAKLYVHSAPQSVNPLRVRAIKKAKIGSGAVVYWMSRDQRVNDNWALLYAQEVALTLKKPLFVVFCLVPYFLDATIRQYAFMLRGLQQVGKELKKYNIKFFILTGDPAKEIPLFVKKNHISTLITDFDPLKVKRQWKEKVKEKIGIDFYEVDTHNIIPCWLVSNKQEYGAYTIRPKIFRLLPDFLTDFLHIKFHPAGPIVENKELVFENMLKTLKVDYSVPEVKWLIPGEKFARETLNEFLKEKLCKYHIYRNDPTKDYQSNLSPYLHFGQISAQRVAIEILKYKETCNDAKNAFLEELIIRRELSDNFCFYNPNYDSINCAPDWAKKSLQEHKRDKRPILYDIKTFEEGRTYDDLWNVAQKEMVIKGKMHGYMRMYWAKKILEWTPSVEDALKIAIYLNDRYELDGRDPNGCTGIVWSICGVHDRAWRDRPVFGKIRYMSYKGSASKFNVKSYIDKVGE